MRFAAPSTCALAAMLCGCAVSPPDNTLSYRPGAGVVEAVRSARVALPQQESGAIEGYQLTLRMSDGTIQRITQDSSAFQVGDSVQVTQDGRVGKPTAAVVTPAPAASVPAPAGSTPAPSPLRPGVGIIESAAVVALPSTSATAGGTAEPTIAYRLRMADGSTQSVVQSGPRFRAGERAQVTPDGRLVRP